MSQTESPRPPSFEQSLTTLESIVDQLEDGDLGLTDALSRYEEGVKLLKQCYEALQKAERKIELLAGVDAEGNAITQPFDDAQMSLEEKAQARGRRRSKAVAKPTESAVSTEQVAANNDADDDTDDGARLF